MLHQATRISAHCYMLGGKVWLAGAIIVRPKKLIICFSGTFFLENDAGGRLFIFYFI